MTTIRVFVASMLPLLQDLLSAAIDGELDMETVSDLADDIPLDARVLRARPDVVILADADPDAMSVAAGLIAHFPGLKVLSVQPDGQRAWLYDLKPVRVALGELTRATVVASVRSALAPSPVSDGADATRVTIRPQWADPDRDRA